MNRNVVWALTRPTKAWHLHSKAATLPTTVYQRQTYTYWSKYYHTNSYKIPSAATISHCNRWINSSLLYRGFSSTVTTSLDNERTIDADEDNGNEMQTKMGLQDRKETFEETTMPSCKDNDDSKKDVESGRKVKRVKYIYTVENISNDTSNSNLSESEQYEFKQYMKRRKIVSWMVAGLIGFGAVWFVANIFVLLMAMLV